MIQSVSHSTRIENEKERSNDNKIGTDDDLVTTFKSNNNNKKDETMKKHTTTTSTTSSSRLSLLHPMKNLKIQVEAPPTITTTTSNNHIKTLLTDGEFIIGNDGESDGQIIGARTPSSASMLSMRNFETIRVIGQGSSGQVLLVRHKSSRTVLAMKKMSKSHLMKKNKVDQVRLERDVLIHSHNPWIVDLLFSFQDTYFVYLLLEYMPGGDLMTWLINKNIFTESETRFYVAELVLSLESVHEMNLVHRDVKPDNILLDGKGHLKLTDFGLCKSYESVGPSDINTPESAALDCVSEGKSLEQVTKNLEKFTKKNDWRSRLSKKRQLLYSTVGSPGYISPEVLLKKGYGFECDWWSVGVIMYEMLYGITPFFDENPVNILHKTIRWSRHLRFPKSSNVSDEAVDLMKHWLCDMSDRLGTERNGGIKAIKAHPFFEGIQWDTIRQQQAPFQPELDSDVDTKYFDDFSHCADPSPTTPFGDGASMFGNFSFKRHK